MKIITLANFFEAINYNWQKDEENIKTICYYTKTRHKPKQTKMTLDYGTEQTFLVKAVAERFNTHHFFEIGTGRGTACYALSLLNSIQSIHTVDILKFNQKFNTAIGYKKAFVSLSDIRDMIPFKEKSKIHFHHRKELSKIRTSLKDTFELCFIDGDHTNKATILEDYAVCQDVMKRNGMILWDDYDPTQFAVKDVVDELAKKDPSLNVVLVEQRGHLFGNRPPEQNAGVLIMSYDKII